MAKLTHQQISDEIFSRGYELIDDSAYKSINSRIIIKCPHGHLVETTLADFRKVSFTCPVCDKDIKFINLSKVPAKQGYRIIAFDQATEKFGLSIFEDGQLIFYSLYTFSGDLVHRLTKIKKFVQDIVINEWQPDFIMMEDIQYQSNGILTFKVLAMLLGIIQELCCENNINFEVVAPNVWRKYAGTNGKNRREEKLLSIAKVKEKFSINVSDDIAEAILIGVYGTRMHGSKITTAFGKGVS